MISFTITDPVYCRIAKKDYHRIKKAFMFRAEYWRKGRHKMDRYEYDKSLIVHRNKLGYFFLRGNLRRVLTYCSKHKIKTEVMQEFDSPLPEKKPLIKGIEWRDDQQDMLNRALRRKWGTIISPTGTGKTLLEIGLISAYPSANVLFLAHTRDLIDQFYNELKRFGYADVQKFKMAHGGPQLKYVVSTIQGFSKLKPTKYSAYFDMVLADEAHHISKFDGQYAKVLGNCLAPIRYGFTATLPTSTEGKLCLEGLVGPVISNFSRKIAIEKEILAKPKVKIRKVPFSHAIRSERRYADVYQFGIVENDERNEMIVDDAWQQIKNKRSTLIVVNKIEHGERIQKIMKRLHKYDLFFVHGKTKPDKRLEVKQNMIDKKQLGVICTVVWKEGVNIPSLDTVQNAAGGKDEKVTLQSIGRGLRRTKEKNELLVIDYFDPSHPYLINHFGERVSLYCEEGWL